MVGWHLPGKPRSLISASGLGHGLVVLHLVMRTYSGIPTAIYLNGTLGVQSTLKRMVFSRGTESGNFLYSSQSKYRTELDF